MAAPIDYQGLITTEHAQRPLFKAVIGALVAGFADANNVLATLPLAYDIDHALGSQLDAVGAWVGISRKVAVPLALVYFSLDAVGIGLDLGAWKGPYDPTTGIVSLDDETYRLLIRTKIGANQWDGSLPSAAALLANLFAGCSVFIVDGQDMNMTLGMAGVLPSALFVAVFKNGLLPLRPAGVLITLMVTTVNGSPIFGFDAQNQYISGFDVGAWGSSGNQEIRQVIGSGVAPEFTSLVTDGGLVLVDGGLIGFS